MTIKAQLGRFHYLSSPARNYSMKFQGSPISKRKLARVHAVRDKILATMPRTVTTIWTRADDMVTTKFRDGRADEVRTAGVEGFPWYGYTGPMVRLEDWIHVQAPAAAIDRGPDARIIMNHVYN